MGVRYPGPLCLYLNPHIPPNDPGTSIVGATAAPTPTGLTHGTHHRPHGPRNCVHGTEQPGEAMRNALKKVQDWHQAESRAYIVAANGAKLQLEDREGLVAQVYFPTDQATVDAQDKTALLTVYNYYAKLLVGFSLRAERPKVHLRFVGYADFRGTERHNLGLSERRAAAVAEYFSPLKKSATYSQGVVGMGEAEHPQRVTPGAKPVSEQLNPFRRVDVFARPLLSKIIEPSPPAPPPDPGSRYWAIRLIDSCTVSVAVVGGIMARLELVDITHQTGMVFTFKAVGGSKGGRASASMDSSDWVYVTTPGSLTFDDFEGHADHVGEALGFVYGYSVDRFVFLGPMRKGASSVAVKFAGWGRQVALGFDLEMPGHFSKRLGPYPVDAKYLAHPPAGSVIR